MKRINVTQVFLPPEEEYAKYINKIWRSGQLTNNGTLVQELEARLKGYLGIDNLTLVSNGTVALQIAIKALDIRKDVITTPFSYIATSSSIVWQGCNPVFVDIDPQTLNIDPEKIEEAITPNTEAILATHVFGNPCYIEKIDKIAKKHNLKVIYDAAHCFGVKYKNKSIFNYGDISIGSFHATKLFHTTEGGAIFTSDDTIAQRASLMRNFGHDGPEKFSEVGINGKNSEFHAAMGLCNLLYVDSILESRKRQYELYAQKLNAPGFKGQKISNNTAYNYSYYPVIFESEKKALKAKLELEKNNIYPRRYFYPSLNSLPFLNSSSNCPISENIASKILCLPMYYGLSSQGIKKITRIITK